MTGVSHRFSTWSMVRCSDRSRRPASPNCGAQNLLALGLDQPPPGTQGNDFELEAGVAVEEGDGHRATVLQAPGVWAALTSLQRLNASPDLGSSPASAGGMWARQGPSPGILLSVKEGFELSGSGYKWGPRQLFPGAGQWDGAGWAWKADCQEHPGFFSVKRGCWWGYPSQGWRGDHTH